MSKVIRSREVKLTMYFSDDRDPVEVQKHTWASAQLIEDTIREEIEYSDDLRENVENVVITWL
ncbi:hypothetical protein [Bacillus cereus]|uniref:hypothetical protein n=1 Tax=Bacillus cereus TaxID=1396 RepID=UPI0018F41A55|nr:hypothetical protein [Bacillus cereus]MBJ8023731.1 hypothetical protein [Bacillus cereus]